MTAPDDPVGRARDRATKAHQRAELDTRLDGPIARGSEPARPSTRRKTPRTT